MTAPSADVHHAAARESPARRHIRSFRFSVLGLCARHAGLRRRYPPQSWSGHSARCRCSPCGPTCRGWSRHQNLRCLVAVAGLGSRDRGDTLTDRGPHRSCGGDGFCACHSFVTLRVARSPLTATASSALTQSASQPSTQYPYRTSRDSRQGKRAKVATRKVIPIKDPDLIVLRVPIQMAWTASCSVADSRPGCPTAFTVRSESAAALRASALSPTPSPP